jgi:hypothetical protein
MTARSALAASGSAICRRNIGHEDFNVSVAPENLDCFFGSTRGPDLVAELFERICQQLTDVILVLDNEYRGLSRHRRMRNGWQRLTRYGLF